MKVRELIEELKKVDPEVEIHFKMNSGCCGDYEDLETSFDQIDTDDFGGGKYFGIAFDSLPGYFSCRQAGVTIKNHNEYYKNKPEYQRK